MNVIVYTKALINKVEYEAYNDKKEKLNLSLCNNSDITIFYSFNDDSIDTLIYNNFKKSGEGK